MREQRAQEATCPAAQAGHEVVQDNLGDVRRRAPVPGDLLTGLEAAQLRKTSKVRSDTQNDANNSQIKRMC
jgi:hypothetical protein